MQVAECHQEAGLDLRCTNLKFLRRLALRWKGVNDLFQPAYDLLDPLTSHLPLPAQDCLNGGGWLLLVPGLIALARLRFRGRRPVPTEEELR
jgi:hypothetical protein